jgi:hypothetical protein
MTRTVSLPQYEGPIDGRLEFSHLWAMVPNDEHRSALFLALFEAARSRRAGSGTGARTTQEFLMEFGLENLDHLPPLADFSV